MYTTNRAHCTRVFNKVSRILRQASLFLLLLPAASLAQANNTCLGHFRPHNRAHQLYTELTADHFRYQIKTQKAALSGNVQLRAYTPSPTGWVYAWGRAKRAVRYSSGRVELYHTRYSTCPPKKPLWSLFAKKLTLDKARKKGLAQQVWFYIKGHRLLYLPYIRFPLTQEQQTGFLVPTFGYHDESHADVTIPYYINLKNHANALVKLRLMQQRGVLFSTRLRYLTLDTQDTVELNYLPDDQEFSRFKANAVLPPAADSATFASFNRLAHASKDRSYVHWYHHQQFDPYWTASAELNYTSDDYYFRDLGHSPNLVNTDQLLNEGRLRYEDENGYAQILVQAFQTLHPINNLPILNQYKRLPDLRFATLWPDSWHGLIAGLSGQFVHFEYKPFAGMQLPTGNRTFIAPYLSWPTETHGLSITPRIELNATHYDLGNQVPGAKNAITRTLPIVSVDSRFHLERETLWAGTHYQQTLEPRLFYLWVPRKDQDAIPLFDTTLPTYSIDSLFRTNRFIGIDRINDANQLTVGLTSRLSNLNKGNELLEASLGQTYYLHTPKVCLTPLCSSDPVFDQRRSPLIGRLTVNPRPHWQAIVTAAWNVHQHRTENTSLDLYYHAPSDKIFNIGYYFLQKGNPLAGAPMGSSKNDLDRIHIASAWPINERWQLFGSLQYNISHDHAQSYLYGVGYNSCCIAVRFIVQRYLIAQGSSGNPVFDRQYYVQIQLKGLGNLGRNATSRLLEDRIAGYHDTIF